MKTKFKWMLLSIITLCCFALSACGDEPNNTNRLVGTWEKPYFNYCCDRDKHTEVYVFKEDGTGSHYYAHPSGDKCWEADHDNFKWSSTPTEIHLSSNIYGTSVYYYTLTDNSLHLIYTDGESKAVYVRK